jgi:hypothetical protein
MEMLFILLISSLVLLLIIVLLLSLASRKKPERAPPFCEIEDYRDPETDIQKIKKQILAK